MVASRPSPWWTTQGLGGEEALRHHAAEGDSGRTGVDALKVLRAAACALLVLASGALRGGQRRRGVPGYLVWVNLATIAARHADADRQIKVFVDGHKRLCWPDGALLFMRARRPGVTEALVRRAPEAREPAAQRRLRALLRQPFGEVPGLDGIVACSERSAPSLVALPLTGHLRAEAVRSATGEDAWGATFCRAMPPVSWRP